MRTITFFVLSALLYSNTSYGQQLSRGSLKTNILNYDGIPTSAKDTAALSFSDQGAWFSFSVPTDENQGGFSGPFLMTQNNGIWSSKSITRFQMLGADQRPIENWKWTKENSLPAMVGLNQSYKNQEFKIDQKLFYLDSKTALIQVTVKNVSSKETQFYPRLEGTLLPESLYFEKSDTSLLIKSKKENAVGHILFPEGNLNGSVNSYVVEYPKSSLAPGQSYNLVYSITFLFPEDDWEKEHSKILDGQRNFNQYLSARIKEKNKILSKIEDDIVESWQKPEYKNLAEKTLLTLQNNWRSAAGNLKHAGLFPSYHSNWFQGFWAWDSWKHAVGLAQFDPNLAKEQVLAMYDYIEPNGFIPDDIFRNNLYEENNYRDTKPPLSGWAIWEIYLNSHDKGFLQKIFPLLLRQHQWWYEYRDHDRNGLCEYGSTDGTLIAGKWESGMDNAVRFDHSKILTNSDKAFSLDQESVDLNSYLYAEKGYISKIAEALGDIKTAKQYNHEAKELKTKIQETFYDAKTGWLYDKNLTTGELIKVMGPEGWIPLWAGIATKEQAKRIKTSMMNPKLFNTKVPLPTLNASDPNFKPQGGYWRGPVWLDQAYFGIKGLQNYGYNKEANLLTFKLIHNAEGVINDGLSIRENYNPITGKGLESQNFSWSAVHYLLLLLNK